jgi:predicted lysophospholipase L1 biosynthesis ABC-type transport system permease subunit
VIGGRTLSRADLADSRVTVLNETAARALFGDADPVGREVTSEPDLPPRRVVGVVEDVRQRSLDAPPLPEMYHPITAEPVGGGLYLTLRTSGDPNDALAAARRALLEMDPRLPISHAERLTDTVQRSLLIHRVSAWGAAAFGVFALLLGAVGIYGVTAFQVSTRKREVGVRVALGAGSPRIMRSIVGRGILPVLAGVTLGLILAWTTGGAVESLVYGVTARDPSTLLGVAAVLTFVALLALLGPATRATRTEPVMALNDE